MNMSDWTRAYRLDSMYEDTGSWSAIDSETTWTLPFPDESIDTIILGPAFGANEGTAVTPTSVVASGGQTTVKVALQDLSDGAAILGRSYQMSVELTRPFFKAGDQSDFEGRLMLREFIAAHWNTGYYQLQATHPRASTRTVTFNPSSQEERGFTKARFVGNTENTSLFIKSDSHKPVAISALKYLVDYYVRRRA